MVRHLSIVAIVLAVSLIPDMAFAQGKIAGRVTDASSGEPLPGAPIRVTGTRQGTTTDVDGQYFLLNLPPGTHTLDFSFIGYQSVKVTDVRVESGRTTPIDARLQPAAIEQEAMVIVAEREVIRMDVSGSVTIMSAEDLKARPVSTFAEAVGLDPAVESSGKIRGGRRASTQVIIDGHDTGDLRNNVPIMEVNSAMVSEVQVQTGGYNAEFGNARAGLIIVATRDALGGTKKGRPIWFSGAGNYTPGRLTWFESPAGEADGDSMASTGVYTAYGRESFEWQRLGTPSSLTDTSIYIDHRGRSRKIYPWARNVGAGVRPDWRPEDRQRNWMNIHRIGVDSLGGKKAGDEPSFVLEGAVGVPITSSVGVVLAGRSKQTGYVFPHPEPAYSDKSFDGKLNLRPTDNLQLDVSYLFGRSQGVGDRAVENVVGNFNTGNAYAPGARAIDSIDPLGIGPKDKYRIDDVSIARIDRWRVGLNTIYALSQRTFAEFRIRHQRMDYTVWAPPVSDPIPERYQLKIPLYTRNGPYTPEELTGEIDTVDAFWHANVYLGEVKDNTFRNYELGGRRQAYKVDSSSFNVTSFAASVTSQINRFHRLKIGGEWQLTSFDENSGWTDPGSINWTFFKVKPVTSAIYIQDRMEYQGMIANFGLRMDTYNSDGEMFEPNEPWSRLWQQTIWGNKGAQDIRGETKANWQRPLSEEVRDENGNIITPEGALWATVDGGDSLDVVKSETEYTLSPRIGISHPLDEHTKIYFNYGHFYDIPGSAHQWHMRNNQPGDISYIANPLLERPRTIQYELGVEREVFRIGLIHLAGWVKDQTGDISDINQTYQTLNQDLNIGRPFNKVYSDHKGIDFRGEWRTRFFSGFINYALRFRSHAAVGNLTEYEGNLKRNITENPEIIHQEPAPQITANLRFTTPGDYEVAGLSRHLVGAWSLNMLWTRTPDRKTLTFDPIPKQGVREPNVWTHGSSIWNMRLEKGLTVGGAHLVAYMDIRNLFNHRTFAGGFTGSEFDEYVYSLHIPVEGTHLQGLPPTPETFVERADGKLVAPDGFAGWKGVTWTRDDLGNLIADVPPGDDMYGDMPDYAVLPLFDRWSMWRNPRYMSWGLRLDF